MLRGSAGDWEVFDEDGSSRSVAASIFERTHEPLGGDRWRRVGEVRGRHARPGEVVVVGLSGRGDKDLRAYARAAGTTAAA